MEIFYILSILYIGTVIGAAIKEQKYAALDEELTVVCPKLTVATAHKIRPRLFKMCEHVKLPETNAQLTKNDELCLLFYNTFILHCNTTQDVNTLFPTDIYEKYNLSTVCDNMAKLPRGTPNNSSLFVDLKKLISSKEKCLEICNTTDFYLPMERFCSLSYYYVSSFDYKTTKLQPVQQHNISNAQKTTAAKQAPHNNVPQYNNKILLNNNQPSNEEKPVIQLTRETLADEKPVKLKTDQTIASHKAKVNDGNEEETVKSHTEHQQEAKQSKPLEEQPQQQPEPEQPEPQQPEPQQPGPQLPEPQQPAPQQPAPQQPQQQSDAEQQPNDQFDSEEDMDIIDDDTKQLDKPKEFINNNKNDDNNNNNNNKPNTVDDSQSIDYATEMEGDSYFFTYFMMLCIIFIVGYVCYHNKQKILALILEGRRGKRQYRSRRPNSANYHKLDSNLEEAITSSCNKNTSNVIY